MDSSTQSRKRRPNGDPKKRIDLLRTKDRAFELYPRY
jgi:hypothetical protein